MSNRENVNPNCDLYMSGYDCVSELDSITCVTCRDFHGWDGAPLTREEVTSPRDADEAWMDPDDHDEF